MISEALDAVKLARVFIRTSHQCQERNLDIEDENDPEINAIQRKVKYAVKQRQRMELNASV
jgi:hypothetical protein